jgi:hypothetical protein
MSARIDGKSGLRADEAVVRRRDARELGRQALPERDELPGREVRVADRELDQEVAALAVNQPLDEADRLRARAGTSGSSRRRRPSGLRDL